MTKVRAIFAVERKSEHLIPTGRIDDEGRILYVYAKQVHRPGTFFEILDEAELRRLVSASAIEIVDEGYDDLVAELTRPTPRPVVAPEANPRPAFANEVWSSSAPAINTPKFKDWR